MTRESIDIEALLIRAYHEQAVDRFGQSDGRNELAWRLILLSGAHGGGGGFGGGERVQTSGFAEKLAARQNRGWAMLAAAGTSLLGLHDAVLGLPTFYVERLDGLDFQVWDAETALRMGHRIGAENGAAYVERVRRRGGKDAKRAAELRPSGPRRPVRAIVATNLVICHGRAADRPFVPDLVVTGRRPVYAGGAKRAVGHEPVYETAPAEVVEARAVYATWRACLGILSAGCAGLPDLDVTGPAAPISPWDEAPPPALGAVRRARGGPRAAGKNHAAAIA